MNFRIYFILLSMYIGNNLSLDFVPQEQNIGLTFVKLAEARVSYDSYTILYHLDITQYKNMTVTIENFINNTGETCKDYGYGRCKRLLNHITTLWNHMKRDEMDIEAFQQKTKNREKRALEFVGNFFHWAFGLLDAESARDYETKITQIKDESTRFHNLFEEQTLLIKEILNLNNKTIHDFGEQLREIRTRINFYETTLFEGYKWLQIETSFIEYTIMAQMLISEHRRISQQLLRCLEEVVSGKIIQLIPKDHLIQCNSFIWVR